MPRHALPLDTLIFFVTSHCNAKCRTCFYWEELNQPHDLAFTEIERLSATMPGFNEIWLSGGEPTLRDELVEIVSLFYRDNGIRSINLPVNGLRPSKLEATVESIFARCAELKVNLSVALDGIGVTHDRIRGVPGNWDKALESLRRLEEVRKRHRGLRLHVNSVVCRENLSEMLPLGAMMQEQFDLDGHYFQVIRGNPLDPELSELEKDDVAGLYDALKPHYRYYGEKIRRRKGFVSEATYVGVMNLYHEIQAENFDRHHRWPMPCTAGRNIVVLDANGDIRSCELRERLGNLRDYDCDWARFWESRERQDEVEAIRRDGCWCTHVCFIHASLKASPKAMAYDVPRNYLRGAFTTTAKPLVTTQGEKRPTS